MGMQKDDLEQVIRDDLYSEAEAILREVDESGTEQMSSALKDDIRLKLQSRIDTYEKEQVYAGLSEKDREALMLGRRLQEERSDEHKARRKRRLRAYMASAAAILLVLGVGITSTGGAERIASVIEQVVGGRKVVKVNSDEENKVSENEDEQKAYQEIRDIFGIEPVRFASQQKGIKFIQMNLDDGLQIAELIYQFEEKKLLYVISAGYYNSSFGYDADDKIIDKENMEIEGNIIELTVYQVKGKKDTKCSAHFSYQKVDYFLQGSLKKDDFKLILKNLYFL